MSRKLPYFLAFFAVLATVCSAFIYRKQLLSWYRFRQLFEYIGVNDGGCREYRHKKSGLVMVWVPGGNFVMGATDDPSAEDHEKPAHNVCVSAFLISKYEVDQEKWESVMKYNNSGDKANSLPVVSITWEECVEFCRRTGLDLPTEAQWEYCAKGGKDLRFSFGEKISLEQVNFSGVIKEKNYRSSQTEGARRRTVAVDSLERNFFGLFNMHGNVAELCKDDYRYDFYSLPEAKVENPVCIIDGNTRKAIRGGGWSSSSVYCRSTARGRVSITVSSASIGFRPVYNMKE